MTATTAPHLVAPSAIIGADARVPVVGGATAPLVNFDHAASTPALRSVNDTVQQFLHYYSSVHRGSGFNSQLCTQVYEQARQAVGAAVGARPDQHVTIFGPNSTWALNKLARRLGLRPTDIVISTELEHHANDLPWRQVARVVYARCDDRGALDVAHVAELFQQFRGRVRLLAVTGGSNVTGHLPPIHDLAELAHAAGAQICVDAAQLAPHRAIAIGDLNDPRHIDYVVLSGHKLYAPFGGGALVGRRDTFSKGTPETVGGGTVRKVSQNNVEWADAPARDEAGTPNVVGAVALAAALRDLAHIGFDAIAAHEAALTAYALERLQTVPGIVIYGDTDPAQAETRLGVIPFTIQGFDPRLIGAVLSCEYGIAVRCGAFCAHPYVQRLVGQEADCTGDKPFGLVRVSFGLSNTFQQVDALIGALTAIATGQTHSYTFSITDGTYWPDGWRFDTSVFSL